MNIKLGMATAMTAIIFSAQASTASAENLNAELLVSNCVVCHGQGGKSAGGTPSINEISTDRMITMLKGFKDGTRSGTIMVRIAPGYTDAQIEAMAGVLGAK